MERRAFGAELRALRTLRGLTVVAAARRAGVSRESLHRWESGGQAPNGRALAALLGALEATPQQRAALVADERPSRAHPMLEGNPLGPPAHPGRILRALREGRSMSQAGLARAVGMGQSSVAKWEAGQALPSDGALGRVAAALGVEDIGLREGSLDLYDPIVDPLDARMRIREVWRLDYPLSIARWHALERELWPLAARDARWQEPLAEVLAWRAWEHEAHNDLSLALEAAHGSLRLAQSCGCWDAVFYAVYALATVRVQRGVPAMSLASLWQDYAARVRNPLVRAFALNELSAFHMGLGDRAATDRVLAQAGSLFRGAERDELHNDVAFDFNWIENRWVHHALCFEEFDRGWEAFETRHPHWRDRPLDAPEHTGNYIPFLVHLHLKTGQALSDSALSRLDALAREDRYFGMVNFYREVCPQLGIRTPPMPRLR